MFKKYMWAKRKKNKARREKKIEETRTKIIINVQGMCELKQINKITGKTKRWNKIQKKMVKEKKNI